MRARRRTEPVDLSDGASATGTITLMARHVRRPNNLSTRGTFKTVMSVPVPPLVSVDGRPVRLGLGLRVHLTVAAGPHLVEVMDDHHYESRTVSVDESGTASLWFGVGLLRSEPRIYLGSEEYAAKSSKVSRPAEQVAAVISVVTFFAGVAYLPQWFTDIGVQDQITALAIFALPVAVFWPLRFLMRALLRGRSPADIGAPAPEPVSHSLDPAHQTMVVPRGATLPPADAVICLHFRADPRALAAIRIRERISDHGPKRRMPYFSNSRVDWLAAPEISVNGQPLPQRWGTLWVPVRPGRVRLRVRLPGFINGQFRGPSTTAELDTTVKDGHIQHVECRYNIVALATARLAERPNAEAEWQRELRTRNQLDKAVRRARAPQLALRERAAEHITEGARLPR